MTSNLKLTESLIVNIRSIQGNNNDKKIITITSPSPYNGKSTVSKFLAEHLVKLGKKVLLVDNDLKRGKLHRSYNLKLLEEKILLALIILIYQDIKYLKIYILFRGYQG